MTEEIRLAKLLSYNWDDGCDQIEPLLSDSTCTYNIALLAFWLADGYGFLTAENESSDELWIRKLTDWSNRLLTETYPVGRLVVDLPLTKVQIYQLKKAHPTYPKEFWFGNPCQ